MSHRSYRPVLPTGNKLLQKKWDQTYYDEHRRLVQTAKPMVDTSAPRVHPHVTSKWKKQQVEKERAEEIERDNLTLLTKMQRIMSTQGSVEHRNTYRHHSLNDLQRQRELERVAAENKQILHRLQKVEPMYKVSDWVDSWMQKEQRKEMITAYPSQLSSVSRPKAKTLPPTAVRGTSASHRPRMAKTTSIDARRGSKVDHHPRKAKPKELGNTKETTSDVKEEGELEAGGGEEGQMEKAEGEPEVKVDDQEIDDAHSEG